MGDVGIGRVLVASLHQGIADVLPTRLGFYEDYLNPEGLRAGTIGVAPVTAVLSFLRQEGDVVYERIMTQAGGYAAEWTVDTMAPFRRRLLLRAPRWLRVRILVSLARRLVRDTNPSSRPTWNVRGGTAQIDLQSSIFCTVREPVAHPLCGFYAAAIVRLLTLFDLESPVSVVACRGTGKPHCMIAIPLGTGRLPSAAALVLLATVLAIGARPPAAVAQTTASRILVMPFDNATRENRIIWLGEAASVLLADDLNAFGLGAIERDERRQAFDQLQVPATASLTDATVIRIGEIVGASQVVVGTVQLDGDQLVVRARAIALESGRIQSHVTERGAMADLFAIFERVARRIMSPGGTGAGGAAPSHPPVAAFENYIKGLLAETPSTAIGYLTAALRADPRFDRVRLALWEIYDDQGEHQKALAVVTPVPPTSTRASRARFLAGLSHVNLQRLDDGFATFKALADARPTAPVVNNLGVIQLRRARSPQLGLPTYYFNKAVDADGSDPDYCFNLGYAYWLDRDMTAATYWLREAVRRDPTDGEAHYVLGAALAAAGSSIEAARERELARRLSSTYAEWEKRPAADPVPKGLERLKSNVVLPRSRRIDEALAADGQRDQRELGRFYLDRARRLYQEERDREALAELRRVVFLSPYEADAHLLIGRIHLRSGRIGDAIDALKISLWSAESPEAHAVLAAAHAEARDVEAARTEAARALTLDPASSEAKRVLDGLPPR